MDNKNNHLQLIQGVINRLAANSFSLKGWSVVLVSALFALSVSQSQFFFALLAYFPAIAFWALDAYFLRQERLFRMKYDQVRATDNMHIDFSMDTSEFEDKVASWFAVAFSKTIIIFHGAVFGSILIVMLIFRFQA